MKKPENDPPKFFLALFRWFCHPDLLEEIEGDLFEQFHKRNSRFGTRKAKWLFIKDVILLFRPGITCVFNSPLQKFIAMKKINWIKLSALNLFIVLLIISPFIPGPYNKVVLGLSLAGQMIGTLGLILVPLGLMWTIIEIRRSKSHQPLLRDKLPYTLAVSGSITVAFIFLLGVFIHPNPMPRSAFFIGFLLNLIGFFIAMHRIKRWMEKGETVSDHGAQIILAAATLACLTYICLLLIVGIFVTQGIFAGILGLLIVIFFFTFLMKKINGLKESGDRKFNPAPVYLLTIPLIAFFTFMFLTNPVSDYSRNYAIKQGQSIIDSIENYYLQNGNYPESIKTIGINFPRPSVMGIQEFNYERNGDAYNLSFVQWQHLGATQEVVMFNKNDEHTVTGHFASYHTKRPHWRYYWLD